MTYIVMRLPGNTDLSLIGGQWYRREDKIIAWYTLDELRLAVDISKPALAEDHFTAYLDGTSIHGPVQMRMQEIREALTQWEQQVSGARSRLRKKTRG